MRQQIRFCTSSDGVRLAYATSGCGSPLVKAANYLTHVELDGKSPVWRPWIEGLSERHTLVRYDERGCGLSDRDVEEYSLDAWVRDLEAVVDAAGLERFVLLGISQGAAVSVAYAVLHPDRVTHLVLYGGYARGRLRRALSTSQRMEAETMINVIRVGWGRENPAFRQVFSTQLMPGGSPEQIRSLNELARASASAENAARMEEAFYQIDVSDLAPRVTTPTMVLHARDDATIPFDEGRHLASLVPEARFVPLESRNHVLTGDEPAWKRFLDELHDFVGTPSGGHRVPDGLEELTPREIEVLDLVARGLSNGDIAERLYITEKTVRNHMTHIFGKLAVTRRAEAVVRAREAGLGGGTR